MRLGLTAAVLALLAGCGMEPFDPPRPDGIKPGPGLFTGESGEFVIFRAGAQDQEPAPKSEPIPDLTRPPAP